MKTTQKQTFDIGFYPSWHEEVSTSCPSSATLREVEERPDVLVQRGRPCLEEILHHSAVCLFVCCFGVDGVLLAQCEFG